MANKSVVVHICCTCCARLIEEGGIFHDKTAFCDSDCERAHLIYRRLCHFAVLKARRFPAHEIDRSKAQAFLEGFLKEVREQPRRQLVSAAP